MATRVGFRVPTGPRGTWRECMHAPTPHTLWVEAWRGVGVRVRVRYILGDTPWMGMLATVGARCGD